jgi:DNA-binding response OmpR family regulator
MAQTCVLIADDEQDLVWTLRRGLAGEGYQVLVAYDGVEALDKAAYHRPDVIILDIAMPRLNGLQVCRRLRADAALAAAPILFLTALKSLRDKIEGLDVGGDDYLEKPFDLGELKARLRALLRRSKREKTPEAQPSEQHTLIEVGPFALNLASQSVTLAGATIQLTDTECALLHHFMLHVDVVFSGRELLQQVWGYSPESAEPGLVRWHIMNLRSKVETDPRHPRFLCTIPHRGYIFRTTPEDSK